LVLSCPVADTIDTGPIGSPGHSTGAHQHCGASVSSLSHSHPGSGQDCLQGHLCHLLLAGAPCACDVSAPRSGLNHPWSLGPNPTPLRPSGQIGKELSDMVHLPISLLCVPLPSLAHCPRSSVPFRGITSPPLQKTLFSGII
jgi:hypothetical protein